MTDQSERLFDLSFARSLSRKLAGVRDNAKTEASEYVSWGPVEELGPKPGNESAAAQPADNVTSRLSTAIAAAQQAVSIVSAPQCESLEELLAWALSATRFDAAFIVDPQGFVISVAGKIPQDFFASMGAALSYASEQLQQVSPEEPLLSAELAYADTHILAMPGTEPAVKEYLMAFLGDSILDRDAIRALSLELTHRLKELI